MTIASREFAWPSCQTLDLKSSLYDAAPEATAYAYTGNGNSVAVITNETAVLGLGNIDPLASKPVMEGQSCFLQSFREHQLDRSPARSRATVFRAKTLRSIPC